MSCSTVSEGVIPHAGLRRPLLSAILLAQPEPDIRVAGTVVDEQAKPVAGVQVVLYAPPIGNFKGDPVEASSQTDATGRFDFTAPPLGRIYTIGVHVCAFKAGFAIAAVEYYHSKPHPDRAPKTRASPRAGRSTRRQTGRRARHRRAPDLFLRRNGHRRYPALTGLSPGHDHRSRRHCDPHIPPRSRSSRGCTLESRRNRRARPARSGENRGRSEPRFSFAIKLKKTSRLTGRIVDNTGRGVAGQAVEIWSRGASGGLIPNPVGFKNGPPRTGTDGAFQTPANLLIGSSYRVVIREPGNEPIISDFFPITDGSVAIPALELRPLRTVSGQVVDRQGKPVPDVEVFQSGDGPSGTSVRTDGSGRFALGGFPIGTAFLFARGDGFRFHGKLLKPGEKGVTIELTRSTERPALELTKLPDPIRIEESRALARRIMEWDWTFETWALIDPRAAVARLERIPMKSTNPNDNRLWIYVVEKLALDHDECWRKTFSHWEPIFNPHVRDFMLDRF